MTESLRDELKRIGSEIETLEARRREIYKRSLDAPEEQKVGPDFVARLESEDPWPEMSWPKIVSGIEWGDAEMIRSRRNSKGAAWVAVRPCDESLSGRTYLGFLLGDMALSISARYDEASGVLSITPAMHNPAIWVPDLGRLVFGCGSWWSEIKKPDDLRQITDADIDNAWYVRAMKDIAGEAR